MTGIYYSRDDGVHVLHISGHAGYSSSGNDIVCAGISAISYALLEFLENYGEGATDYGYTTESGKLVVYSAANDKVDTAFDMALIGYRQIARAYPQHVDVYISAPSGDSRE